MEVLSLEDPRETRTEPETTSSAAKEKKRPVRFIGSFNHSLDNKGRLVIPQGFRDKLGESFCIAPSYDFSSIAVYPTEMWEKRNETYERLGSLNPALNRYLEQFYALSFDEQTCDNQGRVLLPANIRVKILGDERDVEVTGANDHVRIAAANASQQSWESFKGEIPALLDLIAAMDRNSNNFSGKE